MGEKKNTPRQLIRIISYKLPLYIINTIVWIIISAFPLVPGLIIREFFNCLSGNAKLDIGIWGFAALMLSTTLANILAIYSGIRIDTRFRFYINSLIKKNLLNIILNRPSSKPLPSSVGEAINTFRDDGEMIENSADWTIDVLGNLIFAAAAVTILFSINKKITVFVFAPIVLVVIVTQLAVNKIETYRRESREATGKVTGAMGEIFSSVQSIKVFGAEKNVIEHIKTLNNKRQSLMTKDALLFQLLNSIYNNSVDFGTGLILLLGAAAMREGNFSVGDFSLFVYYLSFVSDFVGFIGVFIAFVHQTGISFERIKRILQGEKLDKVTEKSPIYIKGEIPIEVYNKTPKEKLEEMELRNISFHYPDSESGIRDISFKINKNTFTVITGRIGSGKTTLIKTMLGLIPMDSGEILYNGKRVETPGEFFIPPYSAYTPQVPNLISDSLKNNILLGIPEENADIEDAIYSAVLSEDIKALRDGIDTFVGPRGVRLSGGQIQRTAATRMFIRNSELYVFDDISSALDVDTEKKLWERLFNRNNHTCIAVSNRRGALIRADNIIVIKNGKIEAQGKLETLLKDCEEMRRIWEG